MSADDLEEGRRLERRRFARFAFVFLLLFATIITGTVLFHPLRLDIATALDKTQGLLNGILTALAAIIVSYVGASTWEKVSETKAERRSGEGAGRSRLAPKPAKAEDNPQPPDDFPSGGNEQPDLFEERK